MHRNHRKRTILLFSECGVARVTRVFRHIVCKLHVVGIASVLLIVLAPAAALARDQRLAVPDTARRAHVGEAVRSVRDRAQALEAAEVGVSPPLPPLARGQGPGRGKAWPSAGGRGGRRGGARPQERALERDRRGGASHLALARIR